MRSRLHVGCLAWILDCEVKENIGSVVCLVRYAGDHYDSWEVESKTPLMTVSGIRSTKGYVLSKNLMPLGDEKVVKQYKLREELLRDSLKTACLWWPL